MHVIRCDCCGKEEVECNKFSYLCHLEAEGFLLNNAYVDNDGNPVSRRDITRDLCNRCYNDIVGVAVERYVKLVRERFFPEGCAGKDRKTKQKRRVKC